MKAKTTFYFNDKRISRLGYFFRGLWSYFSYMLISAFVRQEPRHMHVLKFGKEKVKKLEKLAAENSLTLEEYIEKKSQEAFGKP